MTTPFEAKGWKSTDKFRIVKGYFKTDEIVTLKKDDNSSHPLFVNGAGDCWYVDLKKLERIEPEWNGEGLPPVGTECEYISGVLKQSVGDNKPDGGTHVIVVAHDRYTSGNGHEVCICKWLNSNGVMCASVFSPKALRPIRSERDKAIEEMLAIFGTQCDTSFIADGIRAIYDAGYRKV